MNAPVVPVYALTDARSGLAHLVTLDAVVAGRPRGLYDAACGTRVLAASLTELHSGQCPDCYGGTVITEPEAVGPLTAPDLLMWIGLRRVRTGGVVHVAGRWVDYARPVPDYLIAPLDEATGPGSSRWSPMVRTAHRVRPPSPRRGRPGTRTCWRVTPSPALRRWTSTSPARSSPRRRSRRPRPIAG